MALMFWATPVLQWSVQRVANPRGGANPDKTDLSSDWRLQLASMKLESLVTVYQPRYGECVPGSCTHRLSSHEREGRPKAPILEVRGWRLEIRNWRLEIGR